MLLCGFRSALGPGPQYNQQHQQQEEHPGRPTRPRQARRRKNHPTDSGPKGGASHRAAPKRLKFRGLKKSPRLLLISALPFKANSQPVAWDELIEGAGIKPVPKRVTKLLLTTKIVHTKKT